ncbi:MAG: DUF2344 domain-containing protein, partial [Myxococcales bacterium]|nr:DUF2344 domain-containing protein [Myxococcales bacterium]
SEPASRARRAKRAPRLGDPRAGTRYRFRFRKVGPATLLGHLDLVRELPRIFRRLAIPVVYSGGFHPKPQMTFSPALSLGTPSLDEYLDVRLLPALGPDELATLCERMTAEAPGGLEIASATALSDTPRAPSIAALVCGARYWLLFAPAVVCDALGVAGEPPSPARARELLGRACERVLAAPSLSVARELDKGLARRLEVRPLLTDLCVVRDDLADTLAAIGLVGTLVAVEATLAIRPEGSFKTGELAAHLFAAGRAGSPGVVAAFEAPPHRAVRVALELAPAVDEGAPPERESGEGVRELPPTEVEVRAGAEPLLGAV